ncbi:MAG: DNA-binding protein [Hymenobacter sp.]|nr:DNA-binding protein [Hymenobacter sp.]
MRINPEELRTLGNLALLRQPKTAFFCSRHYPESIERPTYLWALEQRYAHNCVLSGFHSRLEQAVFRYLLQGSEQPIVYVLGRGIQPNLRFEYSTEIAAGRLLFLTPFESTVRSITAETAEIRNLLLADLADQFFVPFMTAGGNIDQLLAHPLAEGKPVFTLDLPMNLLLLRRGVCPYRPAGVLGRGPVLPVQPRPPAA